MTRTIATATLLIVLSLGSGGRLLAEENVLTWVGCGITKKAFMAEMAKAFEDKTGIAVKLSGGGATKGIIETVRGHVDMGGSCRMTLPLDDHEEFFAKLSPVAWDALALIAHPDNPVEDLSTQQVIDIFLGKITNWKEVGGDDHTIELYIRKGYRSGVGYALRQYLFADSRMDFVTTKDRIKKSSGPIEKAVEKNKYAFAVTGISSARKRAVKRLALDGKMPTYENVRNGDYDLYRPLYLVTSESPSKNVTRFLKFVYSEEGQQVIRDNQVVPYTDALKLMTKMSIYGFGVK